jgi:hypothetical protein
MFEYSLEILHGEQSRSRIDFSQEFLRAVLETIDRARSSCGDLEILGRVFFGTP